MRTLIALAALTISAAAEPVIPRGYRAVNVPADTNLTAVMKTGDHIDLFFIFDAPKGKYTGASFQDRLVLAVSPGKVTLAFDPRESLHVASALTKGEPYMTLRAPGDRETSAFMMNWLTKPDGPRAHTRLWLQGDESWQRPPKELLR